MDKAVIKKILIENHELIERITLTRRAIVLEPQGNYVFIGVRRAGKTFLMFQTIKNRLQSGVPISHILYINFEDERLLEFTARDFETLIDAHQELFSVEPLFFLDEIQVIEGWERFVRRLADSGRRVFVTGSNAKMLSREIASTLGGRFLIKEVMPFSFREYLDSQDVIPDERWEFSGLRHTIRRAFDVYFENGGFPEIAQFVDKRQWLTSLYQKLLYGDLIARHGVRNDYALKLLVKKLAESITDAVSFNRMTNLIKSTGTKVGTSTVIEYLEMLEESFLVISAQNYFARLSERESTKKYYLIDHGLIGLFMDESTSQRMENLIALELRRRGKKLFFAKGHGEVDFLIVEDHTLIQVCYSLQNPAVRKREIDAFKKFREESCEGFSAKKLLVITMDETDDFGLSETGIEVIPLWKWLLG
jgi:predicted AAA+ superfamily ATPase